MKLKLDEIQIDGGTQSRAALNEDVVAEYAEAITGGADMPPVTVFQDGKKYWLADGFHRYFAHQKARAVEIVADVHRGTKREAILHSLGANAHHGLRRTNEDKRAAVQRMLGDKEWKTWSDRDIARTCGVSHPFVASIRNPEKAAQQQTNREASAAKRVESDSTRAAQTAPLSHSSSVRIDTPAPSPAEQHPPAAPQPHNGADGTSSALAEAVKPPAPAGTNDDAPLVDTDRSWLEQIVELRAQLVESQQNAAELADLLDGYSKAEQGEKVTAKEIAKLNGQLRVVASQRDQYMTTCNELKRTVKGLQRENERLKKKVGAAK